MLEAMGVASAAANFGVAGFVAWMWLSERRGAAARDRQLTEAHGRLMHERASVRSLLRVVEENTRAATSLEHSQRALSAMVERLAGVLAAGDRKV